MLKEIETEYKYLLNVEQFQDVLAKCKMKFSFSEHKLQVNYYYDTDDNTLNSKKITVRIRQQHSDMKLQIKKHREFDNGLSTSDEYSEKIDTLPSFMRIPDIPDNVILKGVLVTERQIFSFGKNSSICFDGNMYLGICDYEVEIEVDERDTEEALFIINYLGLAQKPIESKSERFFRKLEAMKSE